MVGTTTTSYTKKYFLISISQVSSQSNFVSRLMYCDLLK